MSLNPGPGGLFQVPDQFLEIRARPEGGEIRIGFQAVRTGAGPAAETLPGFRSMGWFALMAPPGTPEPITRKVSDDLRTVLARPELQERYRDLGTYVRPLTPTELVTFAREEQARWKPVIARVGLAEKKRN